MRVSPDWLSRAAGRWCESLRLVDRHGFHGVGQVSVSCFLFLLLASALLLLGLLRHFLVNGGGLHELDQLRQAWRRRCTNVLLKLLLRYTNKGNHWELTALFQHLHGDFGLNV